MPKLTDALFMENHLPFPYLAVRDGRILHAGGACEKILPNCRAKMLKDILPHVDIPSFSTSLYQEIYIANECYFVYHAALNPPDDEAFDVLYLVHVPAHTSAGSKDVVVGLIVIDNYDEVLDTVEDIRHPILLALIDRKVHAYIQQIGGIIKKFERDRYIFLTTKPKLSQLQDRKFELLNQIRAIDMGNVSPVTLSIGIGCGGQSLGQSMEYARIALDLALGRGGDQALMKDAQNFYFYGGNARENTSHFRVRARVKAYAFAELIQEADNLIVMGHRNPDLDCLGAEIGVYKIAASLGKQCNILFEYSDGATLTLYNRLVDAAPVYEKRVFIRGDAALRALSDKTLLVIVDCNRPSILERPDLLQKAKKIVVFDHHRKSAEHIKNPVLTYHEPFASSTCELITEMLQYMQPRVSLLPVEADGLLAGIAVDTKYFAFKTGAKTFEAAAYLRRNGADSMRVRMFFQNDINAYRARSSAVNKAELIEGRYALAVCPPEAENPSLMTAQIADELLNISGIEASFVLCREGDTVLISARSLGALNVQRVAERLNGGGHQLVAGAQLTGRTIEEALDLIKTAILNEK